MTEALHHIVYMTRRYKMSTVLNIIGSAVAFIVCYLLLTQIVFLERYNHGIKDHERIYRFELADGREWTSGTCRLMVNDLAAMPQVEGVTMTLYAWEPTSTKFKQGSREVDFPVIYCNNTGVSNLTDQVIDGSIEWTDNDQEGVIIPASIAKQYFGTTHAAGKQMLETISRDSVHPITVRGVYKDFPENSTPRNYIMANAEVLFHRPSDEIRCSFSCLVKFKQGVDDINSMIEPLKQRFEASTLHLLGNNENNYELNRWPKTLHNHNYQFIPLDDIYFTNTDKNDLGNRSALGIIELIALLVIIITTINSFNFTLAISPMWIRDNNTRIVLGATRSSIRLRLVTESIITTVATWLLALAVCQALSMVPAVKELFDGDIALGANPSIVIAMLAIAVAIGIIAGVYPAYFATSFQTATALKGSFGLGTKGIRLRTLLIGFQIIIAMVLVSFIGTLYQQTQFIFNSDYGFDFDRLLHVELFAQQPDYREDLCTELKLLPGVEDVTCSLFVIGSSDVYMSYYHYPSSKDPNKVIDYFLFPVDENYFSTLGIKMINGRAFQPTDELDQSIIVNEAMNELFSNGEKMPSADWKVVGVCKNIRYRTTRSSKNTPVAFIYVKNIGRYANIRIAEDANRDSIKAAIAQLVKKHSGHESAQVMDMEETLGDTYSNELRFAKQVFLFSVFCVIIMLVGVFCLMMLETEYRRKEIGIRKVNGATSGKIIGMFCTRYCILIIICFIIAAPLAYFVSNLWLESFAEHQPIRWWVFLPLGLLVVGGLTIGTIVLQCWRATHENPTDCIKTD